ncbi:MULTISPECIES: hypothetical protein [unclassified Cryobacterium]|uniref:hypothetical protein n=1 Tax=unclassified Cryobacterium TaxID=2649013 RepID=UPI002AB3448B|nr:MULTISPECIES: hypothetical protein [unclassified Cryobacterium]MDY7527343.1 hypothetical protein [Cryobacterium sp. 10C2]MDY7556870.1 hypothetical protein [Cryobacterium sp. 10C3]MEB0002279.1 hypothetical protein [Cryobacterium sp. RTC2.1]MEB0202395.1 hypothetical protein [Cryobacterium sp. 5I3]MEB0287383.1 hypothetical protein [Cryobacterium sp. 10S3]
MKRLKYRRSSAAECQFWKANVVRHICQKLVAKKCSPKSSSILGGVRHGALLTVGATPP